VKFIECPDIADLYDEVSALITVLPIIAAFNGDMQYNIADDVRDCEKNIIVFQNIYSIVGVDEKAFATASSDSAQGSSPSSSPSHKN
jgi:hypothetical protein